MRRSRSQLPETRARFYGIAVVFISAGVLIFLLVFPAVEREAYLAKIRTESGPELTDAMMHLCWIRSGQEGIDAALPTMNLTQEIAVAAAAGEVGCLRKLDGRLRALLFLHTDGTIKSAISVGDRAIEPALVALESDEADVRMRGAAILLSLFADLRAPDRDRATAALAVVPGEFPELARRLGVRTVPVELGEIAIDISLKEPEFRPPHQAVLFVAGQESEKSVELKRPAPKSKGASARPSHEVEPDDSRPAGKSSEPLPNAPKAEQPAGEPDRSKDSPDFGGNTRRDD